MDSRKGGKRYSTERQARLKNATSTTTASEEVASEAAATPNNEVDAQEVDGGEKEEEKSQQQEAEERQIIEDYVKEMEDKYTQRRLYREKNSHVVEYRPDESDFVKLDSSLKKNTAFVRKLKTFTESQKDSLMKEILSLNLTKYISEVATAIVETKLKMSDICAAIEVCCLLHERYTDFSEALLENWQKVLLQKKDDKVSNQSKFRVDLRFFAELISVGMLPEKGALNTLSSQLNILINYDKEEHNNVSIIHSFCRHCGSDYAGLVPRRYRVLEERYGMTVPSCPTLPIEKQKGCRNLLKDYYTSIAAQLHTAHKELKYMEWQNKRIILTKGELNNDRQERYDTMKSFYSKLVINVQTLSDLVDEEMGELTDHKFGGDDVDLEFNAAQEFQYDGDTSLFEDEETQQFYEKLLDLRAIVPQILLKDTQQAQTEADSENTPVTKSETNEEDLKVEDVEQELLEAKESQEMSPQQDEDLPEELSLEDGETPEADEADDTIELATTSKLLFEKFLQDLNNSVNRELIDRSAQDFCMNHNTKRNRKRLSKTLFSVPRTRYDLLPFYARLVATLYPCMPDVSADLCNFLTLDFRFHVRKKDQIKIESKIKVVRFIGELVKFSMFAKGNVLKCLKMLMFDFSHHNIDMACALLESCGRFLYRSEDSHHRTRVYLEVMMRKRTALSLDHRYNTMIENAFYYSNPPNNQNIIREVLPPKHEYIRRLLYKDLNKISTEKVLRQMRKLNWKDLDLRAFATSALMAVWNVKYGNIHCLASLISGIAPIQDGVAVEVVDGVLEDIRVGMEINHPKHNQRRLAMVKFLGELYIYKLVDSAVIFKTLYSFITFGVSYDNDMPSLLDSPTHLFRLRLTCVLLDTCGSFFDRGSAKRKLDYFLIYFQKYLWFKKASPHWDVECPFPMSVDMVVKDSLESIRPKETFSESYLEANQKAEKLNEEFKQRLSGVLPFIDPEQDDDGDLAPIREIDETLSGSQTKTSEEESSPSQPDFQRSQSGSQSQDPGNLTTSISDGDELTASPDHELEFEMKQKGPKHLACQEDDDFMAAFDKMLVDNIQQRSQEAVKVAQTDIAVPVNFKSQVRKPFVTAKDSMMEQEATVSRPLKFALMTKKGNKAQFSTLDLDVSHQLATRYREREEEERVEKERLKQLVLEINERQEEEEQALIESGKTVAPNTNRGEKRVKYQHQKGAPDADLIFGSGPKNFTKR